jgi:glycosyltransferase involved in cell wall biosynthesis
MPKTLKGFAKEPYGWTRAKLPCRATLQPSVTHICRMGDIIHRKQKGGLKMLKNAPLVSVIVPVYNVMEYLQRCVESILSQTYNNLEVILVNDGSTDGSGELCDEFGRKDDRIRVIHQENAGVSAARNAGLDAALGEWIGFVDSDDWIEADMYKKLLVAAVESGKKIAACGYITHSLTGDVYKSSYVQTVCVISIMDALEHTVRDRHLFGSMCNKLFSRDITKKDGTMRLDTEIHGGEDRAFVAEAILLTDGLVCIPDALYHYCAREGSAIRTFNERRLSVVAGRERLLEIVEPVSGELAKWARFKCMESSVFLMNNAVRKKKYDFLPYLRKAAWRHAFVYFTSREMSLSKKARNAAILIFPRLSNFVLERLQKRFDIKKWVSKLNRS